MTATAPPQQTRAPRRLRAASRTLLSAIVAVILALAAPGVAAAAVTPAPSPSPTAARESTVTVAPVANGIVRAEGALGVWVAAENGALTTASTVSATLALGAAPLGSRAALDAWLAGETTGVAVAPVGVASLGAIASNQRGTALITVPADDPALLARAPGVYPILATVTGLGTTHVATSVVIVPDDAAPKTPVAVVVPITSGASGAGVIPSAALAELTAADGSLTAQLDAVEGTTAILAIDPSITASIRVLGTSAPATATAWLTRLNALPNARFALQYGDADVSVQAVAGRTELLAPTSLVGYMNPADFTNPPPPATTPSASLSPTPTPTETTPTPTPTTAPTPALPTVPELTDVSPTLPLAYWTPTGSANASVVGFLAGTSSGESAPVTLVASTSTTAGAGGAPVAGHATAGEANLLVYDTTASAALRDAADTDDAIARGAALTTATAELSFAAAGASPLVVTVDRPASPTRSGLRAAIAAATEGPRTAGATLATVLASTAQRVDLGDTTNETDRATALPELSDGEAKLGDFATVLSDPAILTGRERAEVLHLLGAAWIPTPDAWQDALSAHRTATSATLDAVSILPPTEVTLVSTDSGLPFWIRNDLPWPVTVILSARPDNLRLEVEAFTRVDAAPPLGNTRVLVPVQAKVGNGEVTVRLALHSPTGVPIGSPQAGVVNVRAEWERIGLAAIAIAGLGLVAIGAVRMIRRRRASRRTDAAVETDTDTGAS